MKNYLITLLGLLIFLSCEERVFDNPYDSKTTLDPSEWSPTNLVILRLSSNEISLSWEYDRDNIGGFKIDRRINENDWVVEYSAVGKESRKWTDTDVIASNSIIYEYRIYAYAGSNTSAYNTTINNENAPQPVNVTSVTYTTENMIVVWDKYPNEDFKFYQILSSGSQNGLYTVLDTITDVNTTSYLISEFNPLIENWFKIRVTNEFGLSIIGSAMTNSLDSEPTPVDVTSVTYDIESMTITWEEYVPNMGRIQQMNQNTRSSVTNDFVSYELLQSDSLYGTYTSVIVITDQTTTSHSITEYDPTMENWFKIRVTDYWGLFADGAGMTNDIDSYPTEIDITSVTYDLTEMIITWNQSNDNDFVSYELLQSDSENGTYSSVTVITDQTTTSHSLTEFDPTMENWFKVKVTDYWNLTSTGTGMTNEIESTPPTPSVLYPITYNDGFQISWSQNNDDDFVTYKLYESLSEDMSNDTLIYETDNRTDTTHIKTLQNIRYYQITSEDVWGLQSTSNIEVGDYEVELWGEYYSVLNTTVLNLSNSGLTGSIPSGIGNLTNLTSLKLHHNQLTGSIPPEIWNLTNLTVLNLSDNQLTGSIPPEIGNLTNLTHLILDENQLTGSIPSEIWNLTNLSWLWLSNNQLTGEIPESICDLNIEWGNYFNISNNQLCPPYPSCVEDYVGYQDTSDCP